MRFVDQNDRLGGARRRAAHLGEARRPSAAPPARQGFGQFLLERIGAENLLPTDGPQRGVSF
jgi:hypothetical protein